MEREAIVQLRNVTKKIGLKTIIDNVSFTIGKGKVFGLLGPNGAGKTSIIRMMVGLSSITSGEITIKGASVRRDYARAIKHVGAIVENPDMYKFMSGYQNLLHSARMLPDVNRKRVKEVVALVGLEKSIHQKVKTYSLGMRQRLGIAQSLLHRPAVLILDEPTNGLDPAGIRELRDHLRQLADVDGTSVIVSSHLLAEMELMCDEIAIIQEGKLVDVRSLQDMIRNDAVDATVTFEVNEVENANALLANAFPTLPSSVINDTLRVQMSKDQIPTVISALVHAGISIFQVKTATPTLEEKFLQITRGEYSA